MFSRFNRWGLLLFLAAAFAWVPQARAMVRPMNSPDPVTTGINRPLFPAAEQETYQFVYVTDSENPYNGDLVYVQSPLGLFSWSGFGQGIWDIVSEPFKAVSDVFILAPMIGINNLAFSTDLALEDVRFNSMLASGTRERRLTGEGRMIAVGKGYGDLGLTVGTVGIYPLGRNIGDSLGYYVEGDISIDELDYRLSRGAGGQTAAALTGVVASRMSGRGWTGRGGQRVLLLVREASPKANIPLGNQITSIPDDALVTLSGRSHAIINGNPTSFWFRWGDIKNLTPKQYEWVAGRYPLKYLHFTKKTSAFSETPNANALGVTEYETASPVQIPPENIFNVQD
jgi:hypothetical protein